jgi:hypothetical protein
VKSGDRWGQKVWRLRNAAEKRLSEFLHSCGVDPDLWNSRGTAPKAWMF